MGTVPTLIDAGVGDPVHLATLEEALAGQALGSLLITHGHPDHTAGIPAPGALAQRDRPQCPSGRVPRWRGSFGLATPSSARFTRPATRPDHFCFQDESTRDIYCGDLAREGGTIVIPASQAAISPPIWRRSAGSARSSLDGCCRATGRWSPNRSR